MFYEGTVWYKREFDCPTPLMTDWWNYGGLTRPVRIIDVPGTFVQDLAPTRRQTATAGI
jgi:beta-glucuronidase